MTKDEMAQAIVDAYREGYNNCAYEQGVAQPEPEDWQSSFAQSEAAITVALYNHGKD